MQKLSLRHFAVVALLLALTTSTVRAEPSDRDRGFFHRVRHFIAHVLDELGGPKP